MTSKTTDKFAPEVRDRAVRMVFDHDRDYPSRWATVVSLDYPIASSIGYGQFRGMGGGTMALDLAHWAAIIGISGASAFAAMWTGSRGYADAWLKSRFDKALEAFRSEKARELEAFKFEGSRLLDRASKVHQREIEIFPNLWDKMTEALSASATLVRRGQIKPNTERMGRGEFLDYVGTLDFPQWEKDELSHLKSPERDENFWLKYRWMRYRKAIALHSDFHNYFIITSTSLPEELRTELRRLSNLNYDALSEYELYLNDQLDPGADGFAKRDDFLRQWEGGFETVLKIVQGHLWVPGDAGADLLVQRDKILLQAN